MGHKSHGAGAGLGGATIGHRAGSRRARLLRFFEAQRGHSGFESLADDVKPLVPPSRGQKGNVAEPTRVKKARKGHPGAVADRVAQEVARRYLEPILEPVFHTDSYGYRPGKSATDAVGKARERCWRYDLIGS
jgi:hypothetical protein